MSAVHMAFAYLIDPRTPKNSGTFRPVKVIAKPGTIVNPNPPAPVTLSTNHCAQDIAESIIKALAPAAPARAIAGWGRRFRIAIKGVNPRTKRPFIWHMFHARPGGGATVAGDGWETAGEGQAAGGIKFGSVEVAEARFPLTFEHHEFRADSGGDGQHRGGVGAVLKLRVDIAEAAVANTAGDGVRHAPYGLLGGGEGLPHRYRLALARTRARAEDEGSRDPGAAGRRLPRRVLRRRRLRTAGAADARGAAARRAPTAWSTRAGRAWLTTSWPASASVRTRTCSGATSASRSTRPARGG